MGILMIIQKCSGRGACCLDIGFSHMSSASHCSKNLKKYLLDKICAYLPKLNFQFFSLVQKSKNCTLFLTSLLLTNFTNLRFQTNIHVMLTKYNNMMYPEALLTFKALFQ